MRDDGDDVRIPVPTLRHRADATIACTALVGAFAAGIGAARGDDAVAALWATLLVILACGRQVIVLSDDASLIARTAHLLVATYAVTTLVTIDVAATPVPAALWLLTPVPVAVAFSLGPRAAWGWSVVCMFGFGTVAAIDDVRLGGTDWLTLTSVFVVVVTLTCIGSAAAAAAEARQRRRVAQYEHEMLTMIGRAEAARHLAHQANRALAVATGKVRVLPAAEQRPPAPRAVAAEAAATELGPAGSETA